MSIADKINSIETHLQADYEALEDIGADLTNVNKNIENIASVVEGIYDNLPKTTGEDTNLSLTTLKGKMNIIPKGDTQQDGTPTPSTPIDIEVVTGTQEVKAENVNLCKNAIVNATSSAYVDILYVDMDLKPNTTYTISFIGATNNKIYLNENITTPQYITCNGSRQSLTFTTKSSLDKNNSQQYKPSANGWILFKNNSSNTETPSFDNVQIEYGSTATTYTPHKEQTQTISLGDIELCKIGTYQDYLYKSNDKWYKKEYIGKVVFNGSESNTIKDGNRFAISGVDDMLQQINRMPIFSNYFHYDSVAYTEVGVAFAYWWGTNTGTIYMYADTSITDVAGFKTWLSTHNTEVYYALQTPNDIQITNETLIEQLDNLEKLKSYNGATNISSSGNLPMILNVSALKGE